MKMRDICPYLTKPPNIAKPLVTESVARGFVYMSEKGKLLLRKASVEVYVSLRMIYRWPGVL